MALTDENGGGIPATMLVGPTGFGGGYPVYQGGNGGNSGFGNGEGWWIILLFLLLLGNNNWGNNGNGGGNGGGLYPWMNQSNQINDGFRDQMLNTTVNGIQQGVNNLSTQLCNCCSDVQMALANGFSGVEQGANARQMANMQQLFGLQSQFADCCCENRLGIANLANVVQTENCADRAALSDGVRDIITNQTANTQRILDQLCADKIDAKNERIAELQNQLNMANLQASQIAQTAQIRAGQVAEIDAMYNRLRDCPVPTMPVYGMQPIFTCPNNNGCGCGCNG